MCLSLGGLARVMVSSQSWSYSRTYWMILSLGSPSLFLICQNWQDRGCILRSCSCIARCVPLWSGITRGWGCLNEAASHDLLLVPTTYLLLEEPDTCFVYTHSLVRRIYHSTIFIVFLRHCIRINTNTHILTQASPEAHTVLDQTTLPFRAYTEIADYLQDSDV